MAGPFDEREPAVGAGWGDPDAGADGAACVGEGFRDDEARDGLVGLGGQAGRDPAERVAQVDRPEQAGAGGLVAEERAAEREGGEVVRAVGDAVLGVAEREGLGPRSSRSRARTSRTPVAWLAVVVVVTFSARTLADRTAHVIRVSGAVPHSIRTVVSP